VKHVQIKYFLNITVVTTFDTKLIKLVAPNDIVGELVGCSAGQFVEYLRENGDLLSITEGQFVGLRCDITARDVPRKKKNNNFEPERNIEKLIPIEPWVPIARLVTPFLPNTSALVSPVFQVKNFLLDPNFKKQKRDKMADLRMDALT